MNAVSKAAAGLSLTARRLVHHKVSPNKYPKVNIEDVDLSPPKYGFRRQRDPLLSQSVKDTLFPSPAIAELYKKAGKPVPMKHRGDFDLVARKNFEKFQDEIAFGLPHFRVGEKKVYLPTARVILLPPTAKHTPYQARFLVPRNFNKLDLRDYLWHVYGLRALNVTVQLMPAKWLRGQNEYARHRARQLKKMTIDMEEPFIWPDLREEHKDPEQKRELDQLEYAKRFGPGSAKEQPVDAYDGLYNKPELPNVFVSAKLQKTLGEKVQKIVSHEEQQSDRAKVARYLNI